MPEPGDSSRSPVAARSRAPLWLVLEVVEEAGEWASLGNPESLILAAGEALARHTAFKDAAPASACLLLSDAENVRRLNARYRGIDKATNVLSFPAGDSSFGFAETTKRLGDVALAHEVLSREAAEQDIPARHHFQHLVIHGLLHLLGYDHEQERDATVMERLEVEILASLGVADPYSARPETPGIAAREGGAHA